MIMNILQQLEQVKAASREMPLTDEKSSEILNKIADALIENTDKIITANSLDLSRMDKSNPMYDRLLLTKERIMDIANATRRRTRQLFGNDLQGSDRTVFLWWPAVGGLPDPT